jgi:hypothetical protein
MTVKTYWVLTKEDSKEHEKHVDAMQQAKKDAVAYIKERIACDEVYFTTRNVSYLGFKEKPDNPKIRKIGMERHDVHWLCLPKSKTDWNQIMRDGEKIAKSAIRFQEYCEGLWPETAKSVVGQGNSASSFSISETAFGFLKGRVVMCYPLSDGEAVDLSKIPKGFSELTASQYSGLLKDDQPA